jgi:hypothetical protein
MWPAKKILGTTKSTDPYRESGERAVSARVVEGNGRDPSAVGHPFQHTLDRVFCVATSPFMATGFESIFPLPRPLAFLRIFWTAGVSIRTP